MHDFNVIPGMDWLHSCYVCMDCRSRVVRFHLPNEKELLLEGYNSSHPNLFISTLKGSKKMYKGLLCHLVSVSDLDQDIPSIDSLPILNEFKDVFLDDLP